ncbi:MAG: hypothetical protein ISS15_08480 [Alphaproteobacteria bacterium]|nr:hypothetical protein [Alphaproteobacteria bacterium]MBL6936909.1 hypothetical protein [Alphaproteobacteria bacterium]MBL7097678.1 hypothetical protein [Alphaproteobacteria bacterium]
MRIEHEPNVPALRRDWLGARIVGALGLLILLAAGALFVATLWSGNQPAPVTAENPPSPPASSAAPNDTVVVPAPPPAEARRQEDVALCTAALATAQQQGIIPGFATLASQETQNTDVSGRYICLAKTDAARYSIDFDLTCTNLSQGNCIALFNVSQAGGGVLYQRH